MTTLTHTRIESKGRERSSAGRPAGFRARRSIQPEPLPKVLAAPAFSFSRVSVLPRQMEGASAGEVQAAAPTPLTSPTPQVVTTPEPTGQQVQGAPTQLPAEGQQVPPTAGVPAETQAGGQGGGQPQGGVQQPAPAAPTLNLTPGNTLVRGATLTAAISFTPPAGSTLAVTAWTYTAGSDVVNRPTTDANFSSSWSGVMAKSGTLDVTYRINQGSQPGADAHLRQDITVNDRTGAPWASSITENAEINFTGRPNPPVVFSDLGRHVVDGTRLPTVTPTAISGGPNSGFTIAGSLQAGSYISQPKIHPALLNPQSAFMQFHLQAGLLFLVIGGTPTRINDSTVTFSMSGNTRDFSTSQWEAFYKRHHYYTITYTNGRRSYTLPDAMWSLDANTRDATIVTNAQAIPAIRQALGLSATDAIPAPNVTTRGDWDPYPLLQGAQILSGTRSHEYQHAEHSHRANYRKMMRALDPQRKAENKVYSPGTTEDYATTISNWFTEISNGMAAHKLVDEAQSRSQEQFVDNGADMAGVNQDPSTGSVLGSVWNITGNAEMTN